jgi:hypothetical protein
MVTYEFYWRDNFGKVHLIGILPERRKDQRRITDESIMNWVKKFINDINSLNNIFFTRATID